ncbi:MAG: hypothetical protein LIO92_09460 [Clostridiales bacterium]|nr:hypothetical protein [Clostridiales bacterium]
MTSKELKRISKKIDQAENLICSARLILQGVDVDIDDVQNGARAFSLLILSEEILQDILKRLEINR